MSNHGLTADNMMQQFPIALQKDPKMVALGQAIAKVMESRQDEIDSLRIYTRIDELPEWLLDILARDFAVDWYDRSYTLEEKRKTIKDSFYVHRHRGTKAAVERAISAIYPNPKVLEWFEYGGDPYHFKLRITVDFAAINEAKHQQVLQKIICYKNLRSHLDSVIYYTETEPKACYVAAIPCATTMSYTVLMAGCYRAAGSQRTRLRRWCGQHNSDENDHCAARNYPRQGCVCTGACIWQTRADL